MTRDQASLEVSLAKEGSWVSMPTGSGPRVRGLDQKEKDQEPITDGMEQIGSLQVGNTLGCLQLVITEGVSR